MEAKRIAPSEVFTREGLVDDGYRPSVESSEVATGNDGQAEGCEQVRADFVADRPLVLAGVG